MQNTPPLSLHPKNPRYFLYQGQTTALVGSCEDYGCLINLGFDCEKYLHELHRRGLNHDRVFAGAFREIQNESFGIEGNVMAPDTDSYICPWRRVDHGLAADGGRLFDLNQWDERFFARVRGYMDKAYELGIIVEFVLFCTFYQCYFGQDLWHLSPLHPQNNVNCTEQVAAGSVLSLKNPMILSHMERLVEKLVTELNPYPNLFFEICNEPWNDDIPMSWQAHIAAFVRKTESALPNRHLLSMDISCGYAKIDAPIPEISIYNFHYAMGQTAEHNQGLGLPIGLNETGFWGQADQTYRRQGWAFMLSGGALYTNLDYSFSPGFEDGTFPYGPGQPGGGSVPLRQQLGSLRAFLHEMPLADMRPDLSPARTIFANNPVVHMLAGKGALGAYILSDSPTWMELDMPSGSYRLTCLDPVSGKRQCRETAHDGKGPLRVDIMAPSEEEMSFHLIRLDA